MKTSEKTFGYTEKLVTLLAKKIEIDISKFDMNELVQGMFVELEHGSENPKTNITDDEAIHTFKIVMAHMNEIPDYYTRLKKMEDEAESVKTDVDDENIKPEIKKITTEAVSKRFKELCGLTEADDKKQLKNEQFTQSSKRSLLKEDADPKKFKIIKFSNDGIGEKKTQDEIELYKMQQKEAKIKK